MYIQFSFFSSLSFPFPGGYRRKTVPLRSQGRKSYFPWCVLKHTRGHDSVGLPIFLVSFWMVWRFSSDLWPPVGRRRNDSVCHCVFGVLELFFHFFFGWVISFFSLTSFAQEVKPPPAPFSGCSALSFLCISLLGALPPGPCRLPLDQDRSKKKRVQIFFSFPPLFFFLPFLNVAVLVCNFLLSFSVFCGSGICASYLCWILFLFPARDLTVLSCTIPLTPSVFHWPFPPTVTFYTHESIFLVRN